MSPRHSVAKFARDAKRVDKKQREKTKSSWLTPSADSFQNFLANLGIGTDNISSAAGYGFNPVTRVRTLLEWVHRGSWLGGVAVDVLADDMTRAGVEIQGELDPADVQKLEALIKRLRIWEKMNETIKWARLYGGAIGVLLIDGHDMAQPLRMDRIQRGSFKGIYPLDRWMVTPSLSDLVQEFGPNAGLPKYYTVVAGAPLLAGKKIHHSRCVRLIGVKLPYWQALVENLWGLSVLERLYDRLLAFDSATQGASQLVYKAYLRTIKIKGLREVVAGGGSLLAGLTSYVDMMRRFQTIEGITLLDSEDEFEGHTHGAFTGLSDVLVQVGQQVGGALGMPLTRLFGQSPVGMNATGDSDFRMYYDNVNAQQNAELGPGTLTIYRVAAASEGIKTPDDFGVKFRPLWQLEEKEKAELAVQITSTVREAEEAGVVDRPTALKELKQSSGQTGVWTNITDEDVEAARGEGPPEPVEVRAAEVRAEGGVEREEVREDGPQSVSVPGERAGEREGADSGQGSASRVNGNGNGNGTHNSVRIETRRTGDAQLTLTRINAVIKAAGGQEELVKGRGYYYFINVGPRRVPSSGVYVNSLNQLSLSQWLRELEQKRDEEKRFNVEDTDVNSHVAQLAYRHNLHVVIESPAGSIRRGYGWQSYMPADYGYIRRSTGADGDEIDCYVGPSPESDRVFIVDQNNGKTSDFEEHKCMLGYWTRESAVEDYVLGYADGSGPKRIMNVSELNMNEFKEWLAGGDLSKPYEAPGARVQ